MKLKKNLAISESGFVFDPTSGDAYNLNTVGLEIVEMMRQGQTKEIITRQITARYDVSTEVFERYLDEFLSALRNMQLIEKQ